MANISRQAFEAGDIGLRPTETGVEATAATARRIGAFFNQNAGATETLARETERLGRETGRLGSETGRLGSETAGLGRQTEQLGRETGQLGDFEGHLIADTGRRFGSALEYAGDQAVKYLDHQQISHGALAYSNLLMNSTAAWNNISKNADPNDPNVAQRFMENSLEPELEKFKQGGFYTEKSQQWAEAHVDALRKHFAEKTAGTMSTMAAQAAVVNHQQTINALSATVYSDPSTLDFSLAALESGIEGKLASSPNLTGEAANKVRTELLQKGRESIVKSAALGYIEKTSNVPPWATDEKYAPYINGPELKMFEKAARTQARTDLLAQKQAEVLNRQLADHAVHAGTNKIMADNVSIDPQTNLPVIKPQFFKDTLDMLKKNPDAPSAASTARTLLSWGESQQNRTDHATDPTVKQDFTDRMFSADNPTTDVQLMRAQVEGKLSRTDFQSMHQLVQTLNERPLKSPIWQSTMAAVKDQLIVSVPGIPGKDTVGVQNYSAFAQTFIPQYLAKERAGTLEPNALDTKDPNSMISKAMAPFKRSPAQRMQDYVSGAGGLGGSVAAPGAPSPVAPQRKIGDVAVPPALGGIAALQYNAAKKQWRDQTSGKIYDAAGGEVK